MQIRKGSLSYWVLRALEKAAEEGPEMFSYSAQMRDLRNLANFSPNTKKKSLAKALSRLKEKGLIEHQKHQDGKVYFKLTQLGNDFLETKEKWDGKYRVIIWDIPENNRRLRDLLRRRLKDWEFRSVQKSVWVSKKNVTKQLRDLVKELEMEKWVLVFESDDSIFSTYNSTIVEESV